MAQILQDKAVATKFQILIEIAAAKVNIQQKDISKKLKLTPQAISQYIEELIRDGLVVTDGRSKYSVTKEGMNWVLRTFRDLQCYSDFVKKTVTDITVCAAVADCDLSRGQEVGLKMKDGLLLACDAKGSEAKGIAVSDARKGDDVGISNVEGIVPIDRGEVTILSVPDIQKGGSRNVAFTQLNKEINEKRLIGAIGIEASIVLKQIGCVPHYFYGVKEAVVEAAYSGLSSVVICVDSEIPVLLRRLEEEHLDYRLLDLAKVRLPNKK